jgi:hypothetical protein
MSPPSDRKTKPDNPRATPGIPGVPIPPRIVEADGTRGRDSRADPPSDPPVPRVEIAVDDQVVQSMRPRATHAIAKLLAVPAVVAALIALLYAGSGWLDARAKREAAEAALAEAKAKQLAEIGPRVDALADEIAALKASGDPREIERIRKELADVAAGLKAAERDITKLYRARPSRAPE